MYSRNISLYYLKSANTLNKNKIENKTNKHINTIKYITVHEDVNGKYHDSLAFAIPHQLHLSDCICLSVSETHDRFLFFINLSRERETIVKEDEHQNIVVRISRAHK